MASLASAAAMLESLLGEDDSNGQDTALVPYIQALQRWKIWRDNVPLFYSSCVQCTNQWPSLTVQLYPHVAQDPLTPNLLRHAVLYGNKQGDDDATIIVLASFAVYESGGARHALPSRLPDATAAVSDVASFAHPDGDVDRLRYCPSRPELVAAKCAGTALSLYDIGPGLARLKRDRPEGAEGGGGAAAGAEEGTEEGEGGGEGGHEGGGSLLCGGPVSTLKSTAQEDVSLAWGDSGAGGGGGGGLRLFSGMLGGAIGEYAVREDGALAEVTVRRGGHDGDASVMDLAWGAAAPAAEAAAAADAAAAAAAGPGLLASVGTDGRTVLWDPRQALPALQAPRCRQDVNGVGFSPAGPLLATAGNDGIVRVYDVRQLGGGAAAGASASTSSAAAAPPALHRLKGHYCAVRQISFSPHGNGSGGSGGGGGPLLAAADEQGRVLLWQPGRSEALEEGLATRPELLFAHAGHVLPVDDFSWSTAMYGTLASTAGFLDPEVVAAARAHPGADPDLPQPPPAVQVWRPAADMLPPAPGGGGGGTAAPAAAAATRRRAAAAKGSSP